MTSRGLQAHDFSGPHEQSLFAHEDECGASEEKTAGWASPGLHPYGVATTLAAACAHRFVKLPQQVVCSR